MNRRAALILLAVLAAAGCRRGAGPPDANYEKASQLYQQLYAAQLDDAYGDPKMNDVVALLHKVDSGSVDAQAAQTMLDAIQHGREELAKSQAAAERRAAAAQAAAPPQVQIDPSQVLAAGAPDAGPPQDPYGPGASVADINAATGGCLTGYEPFNEQGTGVSGTVYRVVPGQTCAAKLPGFVGQAVLVVNGNIYRRMVDPAPPAAQAPSVPDAGPADAGAPSQQARAPARPPAPAPDAGEPEYQIVYPGQPQPGATPPPAEQQQ